VADFGFGFFLKESLSMDQQRKRVVFGMVSGLLLGAALYPGIFLLLVWVWVHHTMFIMLISNWGKFGMFGLPFVLCLVASIVLGVKALRTPRV
jgi:hypothetical protein